MADTQFVGVAERSLIPPWIIRPLVLWLVVMAAACAVWLGWHVDWVRAGLGISAFVATLAMGGLVGWHRHWQALPLLGVAPSAILLLAWMGLWLSDPGPVGAAGFFALSSFFLGVVVASVVYPLSLAVLGVGALAGAACQRLAAAK